MKLINILNQVFQFKDEPENYYVCTKADTDACLNVQRVWYLPYSGDSGVIPMAEPMYAAGSDLKKIKIVGNSLGMLYTPAADVNVRSINTPDSMGYDMKHALNKLRESVGNVTEFVAERMQWSIEELSKYLYADQIDAVALAIYNFEARTQSLIVGDQTGVGKGRIACAIIRYAKIHGYIPVYCTENPALFSNTVYRDLCNINFDIKPFIMNSSSDASIKDERGNVVYPTFNSTQLKAFYEEYTEGRRIGQLPTGYDYVLLNYAQLGQTWTMDKDSKKEVNGRDYIKYKFLMSIAPKAIFVFDECHKIAGSKVERGNIYSKDSEMKLTGSTVFRAFNELVKKSRKALFLSATFAKTPSNMLLYAQNNCLQDAQLKDMDLIAAISSGGEALEEIISADIVREGQMVRREQSSDGIEVKYITLDKTAAEYGLPNLESIHRTRCDFITSILRDINEFETKYLEPLVHAMNNASFIMNESVDKTSSGQGAKHDPIFSKLFQETNQMLYCIKAEAVALHAINLLKEGKKVVIALSNTMDAFLDPKKTSFYLDAEYKIDFSNVLLRSIEAARKIIITDSESGKKVGDTMVDLSQLSEEGQHFYALLLARIKGAVSGITLSPIDLITQMIQKDGWSVGESTGRNFWVEFTNKDYSKGIIRKRKAEDKAIVFKKFQNNEYDVLIINQSGATGQDAHATTAGTRLKREEVKPRVMIIGQAELDINVEVQKRGRINRTGQILPPTYHYISSAIPAEKRLMMILQKKLLSLDANTTSNQKQSTSIIDIPDFFNKYGNRCCYEYLKDNPKIDHQLGDMLGKSKDEDETAEDENKIKSQSNSKQEKIASDFLKKVSGHVPLLSCENQETFYKTIEQNYLKMRDTLKANGLWDLEVESLNLDAVQIGEPTLKTPATSGKSSFGDAVLLATYDCANLNKPLTKADLEMNLANFRSENGNKTPYEILEDQIAEVKAYHDAEYVEDKHQLEEEQKMQTDEIRKKMKESGLTMEDCESEIAKIAEEFKKRHDSLDRKQKNRESMRRLMGFFYSGRAVLTENDDKGIVYGIILRNKEHHHTNGTIWVRIYVANSNKMEEWNFADEGRTKLFNIKSASRDMSADADKNWLESWDSLCKDASAPREIRQILIGNLLKAYAQAPEKSKLISFTTRDKEILKGILLPRKSDNGSNSSGDAIKLVNVPIEDMYKVFKDSFDMQKETSWDCNKPDWHINFGYNPRNEFLMRIYIPQNKDFKKINEDFNAAFAKVDVRDRTLQSTYFDGKTCYNVFVGPNGLKPVLDILKKLGVEIQMYPSVYDKLFSEGKKLKQGNWPKLSYDRSKIPTSGNNLLRLELKLLKK